MCILYPLPPPPFLSLRSGGASAEPRPTSKGSASSDFGVASPFSRLACQSAAETRSAWPPFCRAHPPLRYGSSAVRPATCSLCSSNLCRLHLYYESLPLFLSVLKPLGSASILFKDFKAKEILYGSGMNLSRPLDVAVPSPEKTSESPFNENLWAPMLKIETEKTFYDLRRCLFETK